MKNFFIKTKTKNIKLFKAKKLINSKIKQYIKQKIMSTTMI